MNKVEIYIGPKKGFDKLLDKDQVKNTNMITLSKLVKNYDSDSREHRLVTEDSEPPVKEPVYYENLVVYSDEYSSVQEHVILNFDGFIDNFIVDNLYLQNPPEFIFNKLKNTYPDCNINFFPYRKIKKASLQKINDDFNKVIIGQDSIKKQILRTLVPLLNSRQKKPVVMLFLGSSGVGKTETAKFIAKCLGGKLFRKQFSMFQNDDFVTYLFGGHHYEKSFAKDLQERETNVVLLDEFDKSNQFFHSAFYQLFDEGVYEDKNYKVILQKSIIICTSNYLSLNDVRKSLGDPIYSRFDAHIQFNDLDNDSVAKIISYTIDDELRKVDKRFSGTITKNEIIKQLESYKYAMKNARIIKSLVRDLISDSVLNQILVKKV